MHAKRSRISTGLEPLELKCPITLELFRDPVSNSVGNTYERAAIEKHLAKPGAKRDPLTNESLASALLFPNQIVRRQVQAFLDAHPDYTPEGWDSRLVPPLPGAVRAALAEVEAAKAARSVARLVAALAALPNAVELQVAGFDAIEELLNGGDNDTLKLVRDAEVLELVVGARVGLLPRTHRSPRTPAAMRNYASHVFLQAYACRLASWLYRCPPYSPREWAHGAALVELALAAAEAHAAHVDCASACCLALAYLTERRDWAGAAAEQGGVRALLALASAHIPAELLQANAMAAIRNMVEHAEWAAVQPHAAGIVSAALRGLSVGHVPGSLRRCRCLSTLGWLLYKDEGLAAHCIAAGAFHLALKAVRAEPGTSALQRVGFALLSQLASSPSGAAVPHAQLFDAQAYLSSAMDAHIADGDVQRECCLALTALQPLIRRRLCAAVHAGRAAHPAAVDDSVAAATLAAIGDALPAPAAAAAAACVKSK